MAFQDQGIGERFKMSTLKDGELILAWHNMFSYAEKINGYFTIQFSDGNGDLQDEEFFNKGDNKTEFIKQLNSKFGLTQF